MTEKEKTDREKLQDLIEAIDSFLADYEQFEEWLYNNIISKDGSLSDGKIREFFQKASRVNGFSDIDSFCGNPYKKNIKTRLERVRLYLYKTIGINEVDNFIEYVEYCIDNITVDMDGINYLDFPWDDDTIRTQDRIALSPKRRLWRMNNAISLSKAIDKLSLRELAGLSQQPSENPKSLLLREIISKIRNVRLCGPSDDLDEHTAVCTTYHYYLVQLKRIAADFIPEKIAETLKSINVEMDNIYSVYEANAEIAALLPDIEEALNQKQAGTHTQADPEPADSTPASNEATKETATLAGFLENHCGADRVTVDRSRNNIKQANKDKKITLPDTANEWKSGKTKVFFVDDLQQCWPKWRIVIPTLPPLKP